MHNFVKLRPASSSDMKILYIINNLEIGGAQRLLCDITNHLKSHEGVEIGIFSLTENETSPLLEQVKREPGIKYYKNKGLRPLSLRTVKHIREVAKNYDVIHSHLFPAGYLTAVACRGLDKPTFYTEHSTHNRRRDYKFLRPLEQLIYSRYSAIACISPNTENALKIWLKSDKIGRKCLTIPNGVDLKKYSRTEPSNEDIFGKNGIPILMISRFTASKDQPSLIRALPLVNRVDAFLVFAGDGETLETCKLLAEELSVADRCHFLGARSDIPAIIKASRIGVQASNWEGFGLTAVEMMGGGLPVIASDVPGLREVVEGAGLLFSKGDHKELASRINYLLDNEPAYRGIRAKCEERAKQYDISATAESYLQLYSRHLSTPCNSSG